MRHSKALKNGDFYWLRPAKNWIFFFKFLSPITLIFCNPHIRILRVLGKEGIVKLWYFRPNHTNNIIYHFGHCEIWIWGIYTRTKRCYKLQDWISPLQWIDISRFELLLVIHNSEQSTQSGATKCIHKMAPWIEQTIDMFMGQNFFCTFLELFSLLRRWLEKSSR